MCKYSSQCSEADHFYEAYSGPYTDIYDNAAALATTLIEDCYATIKTRYHMSKNSRLGRKPLNKQTNKQTNKSLHVNLVTGKKLRLRC